MDHTQRFLIAASLAFIACGTAQAADPVPKPDDKPAAVTAQTPAVKELPSRPFPKVQPPARNAAGSDKTAGAGDKPDAGQDKADASQDKPIDKLAAAEAQPLRKPQPKPKPKAAAPVAPDPALNQVVHDTISADAHGQSDARAPYIVQRRDTLDVIIKKTLPTTPFSQQILREAFMKANPQVFPGGRLQRLRAGQSLRIPDAAIFRLIVLGETSPPPQSQMAAGRSGEQAAGGPGPVLNPTALPDSPKTAGPLAVPAAIPMPPSQVQEPLSIPRKPVDVASAALPPPAVSPEEKKKWVRFP